jgi:hypothetical protein
VYLWLGLWVVEQVEERSLRTHLIQLESERLRMAECQPLTSMVNGPTALYLHTP